MDFSRLFGSSYASLLSSKFWGSYRNIENSSSSLKYSTHPKISIVSKALVDMAGRIAPPNRANIDSRVIAPD